MQKRLVVVVCLCLFSSLLMQCKSQKPVGEEEIQKVQTQSFSIESIRTSTQLMNSKEAIYELQYSCLIVNSDLQDSKILTAIPILKSDFKPYVIEEKPLTIDVNQLIRHNEKILIQGKIKFQTKKVTEETQKTWKPYIMGIKILNEKTVLAEKKP